MKPGSADAKLEVPRARVYLRVSRKDEMDTFENQRQTALDHVTREGMKLTMPLYEDFGRSGGEERPGLGKLLKEVRRGDIVVFTSLSRMTRGGVGAALDILRQLERMGVGWHFVEQPILDYDAKTPKLVKDIILAVFAAIDEDYRRRISVATRAAFARKRALNPDWRGPGRPKKTAPHVTEGGKRPPTKGSVFRDVCTECAQPLRPEQAAECQACGLAFCADHIPLHNCPAGGGEP